MKAISAVFLVLVLIFLAACESTAQALSDNVEEYLFEVFVESSSPTFVLFNLSQENYIQLSECELFISLFLVDEGSEEQNDNYILTIDKVSLDSFLKSEAELAMLIEHREEYAVELHIYPGEVCDLVPPVGEMGYILKLN